MPSSRPRRAALVITGVLLLGPLAGAGVAGEPASLSVSEELVLGQQMSNAIERDLPLLRDPKLTWYVNLRGRQLAAASPRNDIPYFLRVIDSDAPNAFAIPGGHIYLTVGMLQLVESEAELSAVIAHELGHLAARHGATGLVRRQWMSLALDVASVLYGNPVASLGANLAGGLAGLKLSRDAEREADRLAVDILLATGSDPAALVTLFERLLDQKPDAPNRFEALLATHPPTEERIANLRQLVAAAPLASLAAADSDLFEDAIQGIRPR